MVEYSDCISADGKTLTNDVLDMKINNLMVRFQWGWLFEEFWLLVMRRNSDHTFIAIASWSTRPKVVTPDRVLSLGQIEKKFILMINWINRNRTVFDIETVWNITVMTFKCVQTKSILILKRIRWIRTVRLNWIAWKVRTYIQEFCRQDVALKTYHEQWTIEKFGGEVQVLYCNMHIHIYAET